MRMERDVFPVAKKELILFSGIQFGSWHTFNAGGEEHAWDIADVQTSRQGVAGQV